MKATLLAVLILSVSASVFAKDHPSLDFFIIYENPFKNAEPVSVFSLNLKGYRSPNPDLQITHLRSATLNSQLGGWIMQNSDGTVKEEAHEMEYNVTVVLEDQDEFELTALSEKAEGQRVLLQIGSTPIIAPIVHTRLEKSFLISLYDKKKAENLLERLLLLVDTKQTEQGAAANP